MMWSLWTAWWIHMFSIAFAPLVADGPDRQYSHVRFRAQRYRSKRQRQIILRELVIALSSSCYFISLGDALLGFLNVTLPTILVSGGIILFLIALKMVFPRGRDPDVDLPQEKEPFIVPLAVPLVAGPAVLAAVILYSGQHKQDLMLPLTSIVVAWAVSTAILLTSAFWKRVLGWRGLIALERLMGLILTLIAVQMFLEGFDMFLYG